MTLIKHSKLNEHEITYVASSSIMSFRFVDVDGKIKYYKKEGPHCDVDNEIIADAVYDNLGITHVAHQKAVYVDRWGEKHVGTVSEEYKPLAKDVEVFAYSNIVSFFENTVSLERIKVDIEDFFGRYHGIKNVKFSKNFDKHYKQLAAILYLFSQKDPYANNFEFMVKKNGKDECFVTFSPFFDNSLAFFKSISKLKDPKQMTKKEKDNHLVLYRPMLLIESKGSKDPYRETLYKQIYKQLKTDKEFRMFYSKLINLDLEQVVKQYSKNQKNKKVSDASLKIATECFEGSKALLVAGVSKQKQKEEEKLLEESKPNSVYLNTARYL